MLALLLAALLAEATVTRPYRGVTYIERKESTPRPVVMHIVQVDLTAPGVSFRVSPPAGARETVRETVLAYLERTKAQVAINAHFFTPYPSPETESFLVGLAAADGKVYSQCETPQQSYALVANAPALHLDRDNHASIVSCDTHRELWNAISGSAQIVTHRRRTIPVYKDDQHPAGELTPGGPGQYSNAKSWYDAVNARTAIGLSEDRRTLTLFTVDARGGSEGMKVGEVADVLIADYVVADALNLDGGGSTTLVLRDPATGEARIANAPTAGAPGRAVASSLAVFADPL